MSRKRRNNIDRFVNLLVKNRIHIILRLTPGKTLTGSHASTADADFSRLERRNTRAPNKFARITRASPVSDSTRALNPPREDRHRTTSHIRLFHNQFLRISRSIASSAPSVRRVRSPAILHDQDLDSRTPKSLIDPLGAL